MRGRQQPDRWLALPVVPRPLGFNARLQFLHPTDAVNAFLLAVDNELPGTFNVAADDAVTLTQVCESWVGPPSACGTTPGLLALGRRARLVTFTADELRGVTWGRLLDTGRITAAGFRPHYTSRRAVEESPRWVNPGSCPRSGWTGSSTGWPDTVACHPASSRSESVRP